MTPARAALTAAFLLIAAAACDDVTGSALGRSGVIVLENRTDTAVVVLPVDLSLAPLLDPAPTLPLPDDPFHVLPPGRSMSIAVEDIDGDFEPGASGLALYVYEARATEAVYAGVLQLTAHDLARRFYHLRLDRVRPPGLR